MVEVKPIAVKWLHNMQRAIERRGGEQCRRWARFSTDSVEVTKRQVEPLLYLLRSTEVAILALKRGIIVVAWLGSEFSALAQGYWVRSCLWWF